MTPAHITIQYRRTLCGSSYHGKTAARAHYVRGRLAAEGFAARFDYCPECVELMEFDTQWKEWEREHA